MPVLLETDGYHAVLTQRSSGAAETRTGRWLAFHNWFLFAKGSQRQRSPDCSVGTSGERVLAPPQVPAPRGRAAQQPFETTLLISMQVSDSRLDQHRVAYPGPASARWRDRRAAASGSRTSLGPAMAKKYREVREALKQAGWQVLRQKGSHEVWGRPGEDARIVVAGRDSDSVPAGTLSSIRRASGLEQLR